METLPNQEKNRTKYINPYLGGVLMGIVLLVTIFISGRELGISGAVRDSVVATANVISPTAAKESIYYGKFLKDGHHPMDNWLDFEVLGVMLGGLLSGIIFKRVRKPFVERGPNISRGRRLTAAVIGGVLFGFGTRLGRGCTSGAALSGSSTFAFGGLLVMVILFGAAFAFAYFFRKLWI